MTTTDWIMIAAIFLGPFCAVLVTEWIRKGSEARQRKIHVFRTLMSTRASAMAPTHVEALNLIDIEFDVKKGAERPVIEAWKLYHSHLGDKNFPKETWGSRCEELLVDLLHEMSKCLGYPFDKAHIKDSSYYPKGYGEIELDQISMRKGFVELLEGRKALNVISHVPPDQLAVLAEAQKQGREQAGGVQPAPRLESGDDNS